MRDRLAHRGPDGAGAWWSARRDTALAHRRLAVIEPTPSTHGAQPMTSPCGRWTIVYNGELYNDAEIRDEVRARGGTFRTRCDTETVLLALSHMGAAALALLRGMFALALYDEQDHTLLLARDPLGIKPLVHTTTPSGEFIFASEAPALLEHPEVPARPDPIAISAYLTTIRTTLGDRTLFAGVRCVEPGTWVHVAADRVTGMLDVSRGRYWRGPALLPGAGEAEAVLEVRKAVGDSVRCHLRSDVPACCLLSGGLDSSVIVHETVESRRAIQTRTYCSGGESSVSEPGGDFDHARRVAAAMDTRHTEAPVSRETFAQRWPELIERLGTPLSTPNEVAINEVCRRLRSDGQVVALSGEGADEVFAGYDLALAEAAAALTRGRSGGEACLTGGAWVQPDDKHRLLNDRARRLAESDDHLRGLFEDQFRESLAECGPCAGALDAVLRMHRRINLVGLLGRLDTASMLEGVEGRTPFADVRVVELAESLPLEMKLRGGVTKAVLREAYGDALLAEVLTRPKASFPLPFQEWLSDAGDLIGDSAFLAEFCDLRALAVVAQSPQQMWNWAWPLANLAIWGRRWS